MSRMHVNSGAALPYGAAGFVGRTDELEALIDLATAAPSLALIEGEAGVGKSRLVSELLDAPQLDGYTRLTGSAHPTLNPFPLGPFVEAIGCARPQLRGQLEPITGALRPLMPELSDALPPPLQELADGDAERHRIFRAVAAILEHVAPAVVVLEDLHWADEGTVELLAYLARQAPAGVAIVSTFRREELTPASPLLSMLGRREARGRSSRINLGLLSAPDVGRLAASMLREGDVSREFATYLHERTSGLPFAVEEVLQLLREREDLVLKGGRWVRKAIEELEVPSAVVESVMERFYRLPPAAAAVLEVAAVLNTPSPAATLVAVAGAGDADGITGATTCGLLQLSARGYQFRHALARDAVYQSLDVTRRQILHERAAKVLLVGSGPPPLSELAYHFKHAGDVANWARYAEAAADLAGRAGNYSASVELLFDVLECSPPIDPATTAQLALTGGTAAVDAGAWARGVPLLQRVIAAGGPPAPVIAELRFVLGRLLLQAGRPEEARRAFEDAVEKLESRPALRTRAMASVAFAGMVSGRPLRYLPWLERARAEARVGDDPLIRLIVDIDLASVLLETGDPRGRQLVRSISGDVADPLTRRQLVRLYGNAAVGAMKIGDYPFAQDMLDDGFTLLDPDSYWAEPLVLTDLYLRWYRGNWRELHEACDRLRAAAGSSEDLDVSLLTAQLEMVAGCLNLGTLQGLISVSRTRGATDIAAAAIGSAIRLLLASSRGEEALAYVRAGTELLAEDETWVPFREVGVPMVRALLAVGDRAQAQEVLRLASKGLVNREAPGATAALLHGRALAGDPDDIDTYVARLAEAKAAWGRLPQPYDAAQAHEDIGVALLSRYGDPTELSAALAEFEVFGAPWDAARVRRHLRQQGFPVPSKAGRKAYGDRLSPREEEVVQLVARGKTNREIGEELFLSARTVGDHVSRALRKLGLTSRRDLMVSGLREGKNTVT